MSITSCESISLSSVQLLELWENNTSQGIYALLHKTHNPKCWGTLLKTVTYHLVIMYSCGPVQSFLWPYMHNEINIHGAFWSDLLSIVCSNQVINGHMWWSSLEEYVATSVDTQFLQPVHWCATFSGNIRPTLSLILFKAILCISG